MRIVVYGGSFNPPHLGHVEAARTVSAELAPDKFLIIPTNVSPHKMLAEGSPEPRARLEMCRLAFAGIPGAEISDMELQREGKSYTAQTVEELRRWQQMSGLPLKKFFNTSGLSYKALGLKEKLPNMTEEEQLALLAGDGMLIKRPLLVGDDFVLTGFRQAEWEARLG